MKLTSSEKFERKVMLKGLQGFNGKIGRYGRVTVVIVPTCRGKAEFTYSICSDNDEFSRKRGEYAALMRWNNGITLPIETYTESDLYSIVENIATLVTLF